MNRNKLFYSIVYTVLILLLIVVLYPLIYIVSASFSSPNAVSTGKVILFPVDFSLEGYKEVMKYSDVWIGYRNTILYTVAGTVLNVVLTMLTGFGLSRKGLPGRKFITFLFTFTMLFSGGLVPTYLVMNRLNLINTPFAMIFPGAINITNMIIARTFISSIPDDLEEAAMIDGCSHARYFFEMVVPLSKAIIAVLMLYYAVGHWNAYFNALIYLSNRALYPLQLFLREILVLNTAGADTIMDPELEEKMRGMAELLKYALIVVSTAPILCAYPFAQKYFTKGVMVGSLKG
ncbi:carbohydrate ABC transporter permease [Lachnotalea sp. AF33-28]|jgi:putative aldouronate transport system permease protein|uniref:carbohydrate ABC transporter permease n=1 Tax=Lachnotalea sp. AF33-28 TaxID=2292046 RepID=UPI000E4DC430|nr:carbohydrate ABC transporter permease [Lachnotalea sp. AF33-28]RHP33949.1 carbohydrate ABC transporter permease [Lachnotalea sp. AF33-28]